MWGAGEGKSEFYPWMPWRELLKYAQQEQDPYQDGYLCKRVVTFYYEGAPTEVGIQVHAPDGVSPDFYQYGSTAVFTVITMPTTGDLVTTYPGEVPQS